MNYNGKIYICHYTPLSERFEYMNNQSIKYNIQDKLLYIKEHDREVLKMCDIDVFNVQKLKYCEISLFMKHIQCYKNILDANEDYGIVMEDDVIFKDNFINNYNNITTKLPEEFDVIYLGVFPFVKEYKSFHANRYSYPTESSTKKIENLFDMTNISVFPWTGNNKGTDFYIISKTGCKKILSFIQHLSKNNIKISDPIDHFMGKCFYKHGIVYWSDSDITLHGSTCKYITNGIFKNSMIQERGH